MEDLLKFAIAHKYNEEGIEGVFKLVVDKEIGKKQFKERVKEGTDLDFEFGRVFTKLDIAKNVVDLKAIKTNLEDRKKIAEFLIETANELSSIEGVKENENDK